MKKDSGASEAKERAGAPGKARKFMAAAMVTVSLAGCGKADGCPDSRAQKGDVMAQAMKVGNRNAQETRDEFRERIERITTSPDYVEASGRLLEWMRRLDGENKAEAEKVMGEATRYFRELRDSNPEVYEHLVGSKNQLLERANFIITGERIIID